MKILQIANNDFFSTYGGGQVYVKNLVDEMLNQDMDVVVFSKNSKIKGNLIVEKKYKGTLLYEFPFFDKNVIKNKIKQLSPDILHVHADKAFFSEICNELSIPCVITAHHGGITCPAGTLMNYKKEICRVKACQKNCSPCVLKNTKYGYRFYPFLKIIPESLRLIISRIFQKLPFIYYVSPIAATPLIIKSKQIQWKTIVENVTLMIAPSQAIAENMILNGLDMQKIVIIPHGIPINPAKSSTFTPNRHRHIIKFFYIGRIFYVKGTHILLRAFSRLAPSPCELHLIGDIENKYAKNLAKKYSGNRSIVFHGKISPEEVTEKIKEFDVLVHPTICLEVFGLNIAEALSERKPVIATTCGGAEMQIRENENGLLVAPNNVGALFHAMRWMVDHPEEVHKMSERAASGVVSIREHVNTIKDIYRKILSKSDK